MVIGLDFGLAVLSFVLVIGPLIIIHELGHFFASKFNNVAVEEFGFGYPPRMLTLFERNGTKYTLNWLPLGGFVRPKGEDDPAIPDGLSASPKRVRFMVLVAGPVANFIAAFVLLVLMFMLGFPAEAGVSIAEVEPGSPAAAADLRPGDVILYADDVQILSMEDLRDHVFDHIGEPIVFEVERNSELLSLSMVPRTDWPENQGPTGIKMNGLFTLERHGLIKSSGLAVEEMGNFIKLFISIPQMLRQNQVTARELRPLSVIGISQLGGKTIEASLNENAAWPIIRFTAYISLALGIFNLLPIPALDGGRISLVLVEALRGKRMQPEKEMMIHLIGFAFLLTTMILFLYLDIVDPIIP